jgi:TRAP-type C4-dicarboxylate transport system substrate-binding protein
MKTLAAVAALGILAMDAGMLAGVRAQSASGQSRLTMVGAWKPGVSPAADMGIKFKDTVNQMSGGKIVIDFKGASDVVPTFDQPEALVRGVFDVWYGAPNYWAGIVRGGYLTEMSPYEIPDNGPGSELFEFVNKLHEAHGARYLGHMTGGPGAGNHFLYTQKKITRSEDLKGMKIRVPPLTRFFVAGMGAEPVTIPPGEIYLALERGTVEGFTWPVYDGFTNFGWQEVSKFMVAHPLYRDGISIAVNIRKWNGLPDESKKIMFQAAADTQAWARGFVAEQQAAQLNKMKAAGMTVIEFTPAEAKRWEDTAREALWAHFKTVMSEKDYASARRLLGAR